MRIYFYCFPKHYVVEYWVNMDPLGNRMSREIAACHCTPQGRLRGSVDLAPCGSEVDGFPRW